MKHILVIDESQLFRNYLKEKLHDVEGNVTVETAVSGLDGISKCRKNPPDVMIIDYHLNKNRQGCLDVLRDKMAGKNTALIPVVVLAEKIDQQRLIQLVPYRVKKVFTKPIKIDALFATLQDILNVKFAVDEAPGIIEAHVNDNIIFIEIAQGLNRDKLDLLGFKIIELINLYEIRVPKLIIMMTDMQLGFSDAPNIRKLFQIVVKSSHANLDKIWVLTRDEFTKKFIQGQKDFSGIEVVTNLQYAMDALVDKPETAIESGDEKAQFIGDRLLTANRPGGGVVTLNFNAETKPKTVGIEELKESIQGMHIASVDDDVIIQELIKNTFAKTGAIVHSYSDGMEFLANVNMYRFDLVFLDLLMPKMDGFQVLKVLKERGLQQSIIVLSAVTQRETVLKAFSLGVKSYLTKPLKPIDIFKKSIEIIKPGF
ncbi:response regulator [Breznakiellaceae bacterium SP9]